MRVAAVMAVALLLFAGVKSPVMQVQMALGQGMADCGMTDAEMAKMGGHMQADPFAPATPEKAPASKPAKAGGDICAFCADAAHAPLVAYAEPIRPPSAVRFTPTPARPPLGARAPPTVLPKARGPPADLLTA